MTDNDLKPIEFADLDPPRDLWPVIESRLSDPDMGSGEGAVGVSESLSQASSTKASGRRPWMGVAAGIAASLAITVSAVLMWQSQTGVPDSALMSPLKARAMAMQQAHEATVAPLLAGEISATFEPALTTLDDAEAEIFAALDADAENPALLRMLANLYHRRAGLLIKTQKTGRYT